MRTRLLATLFALALVASLALAPVAGAYNDGRGLYGDVKEEAVTFTGLALIIFFPLFVFSVSMLQRHLDKRKEVRKAAHKAFLANGQWRGGW
jgi:hypothetical protein